MYNLHVQIYAKYLSHLNLMIYGRLSQGTFDESVLCELVMETCALEKSKTFQYNIRISLSFHIELGGMILA